jgi:hypothetical protein
MHRGDRNGRIPAGRGHRWMSAIGIGSRTAECLAWGGSCLTGRPIAASAYAAIRSESCQSGIGPSQPIGECPLTGLGIQKRKVWNPPIPDIDDLRDYRPGCYRNAA